VTTISQSSLKQRAPMAKLRKLISTVSFTPPVPIIFTSEQWERIEKPYGICFLPDLRSEILSVIDAYANDVRANQVSTSAPDFKSELEWLAVMLGEMLKRRSALSNQGDKGQNISNHLDNVMMQQLPFSLNLAVQIELQEQGLRGNELENALRIRGIPPRPWRMPNDVFKDLALMRSAILGKLVRLNSAVDPLEAKEVLPWNKWVQSLANKLKDAGLPTKIRTDGTGRFSKFPQFLFYLQKQLPKDLRLHQGASYESSIQKLSQAAKVAIYSSARNERQRPR
jgi:hypothetical protein